VPAIDQAANRATAGTVHPTIKKEAEQRSVHDNIMLALLIDVRGTVMWKKIISWLFVFCIATERQEYY